MVREFPNKLGQEVGVILPRGDGSFYRACPDCEAELDLDQGEWVADFPDRKIHGYRISQLFSSTVDPGEILREYRTTRFADRFYNLKIGVPWADLERRLDVMSVLARCGDAVMAQRGGYRECIRMGVDTGRELHVVIIKPRDRVHHDVIFMGVVHEFSDLDALMERYGVEACVIDGLPETHPTREFAKRHHSSVYMNFFAEHQRGGPAFDRKAHTCLVNRTEALDASRAAIRDELVTLPRRSPIAETFAKHLSADAKILDEDEETGIKKYRYIKTGENHFSLAFTYAILAAKAPIYRYGVW
jgi:hypothetical protein